MKIIRLSIFFRLKELDLGGVFLKMTTAENDRFFNLDYIKRLTPAISDRGMSSALC